MAGPVWLSWSHSHLEGLNPDGRSPVLTCGRHLSLYKTQRAGSTVWLWLVTKRLISISNLIEDVASFQLIMPFRFTTTLSLVAGWTSWPKLPPPGNTRSQCGIHVM